MTCENCYWYHSKNTNINQQGDKKCYNEKSSQYMREFPYGMRKRCELFDMRNIVSWNYADFYCDGSNSVFMQKCKFSTDELNYYYNCQHRKLDSGDYYFCTNEVAKQDLFIKPV